MAGRRGAPGRRCARPVAFLRCAAGAPLLAANRGFPAGRGPLVLRAGAGTLTISDMSVLRWFALALVVVTAAGGCTVEGVPTAGPSGGASGSASGSGFAPPCPWSELRGQDLEPETGRAKLVRVCLAAADRHDTGGYVYRTAATTDRADRYTEGTSVAVLCVERNGQSYRDSGGHTSTVWFRIDGEFASGDAQGWVPHAATGYAGATAKESCGSASPSASA